MRIRLLLLGLILWAHAPGQQPATPEQQVYERFRAWVNVQPVDVQRSPEALEKYRGYLRTQGASDKDIDSQIRIIETQSQRLEIERWNKILTADKPWFNTKPNAFLVEMVRGRQPGKALDVGMGQGRNAIWLAQAGWDVTGFDPAERAVALARQNAQKLGVRLTAEVNGMEDFNFGESRWDLIVLSYVGAREINDILPRSLRPGGIVVLEAFHRDATKGGPIGAAVVFDPGELPSLFKTLRVVRYQEPLQVADFGLQRERVVQFCAEKPVE
jgi:SAM-dependent methyltransferase